MSICKAKYDETLKENIKIMNEERIPNYVRMLEAFLQRNGGIYFVGDKVRNPIL